MRTSFIVISSILTVASAVPYLMDVLKGKTKPRVVSWFIWSVLTGIATAASFVDHQYASAILTFCASIETLSVVILGLIKSGDRTLEKFDVYCLVGAVFGLVLWLFLNSPSIAVLASVVIDMIGAAPTVKHIWQKPHEETWLTFLLASIGGLFTVLAAKDTRITAVAYPIYIMLVNALFVSIIFARHKYTKVGKPAALREL